MGDVADDLYDRAIMEMAMHDERDDEDGWTPRTSGRGMLTRKHRDTRIELSSVASKLIKALKDAGVVILRYDAYSTNSIYLKLDYGVCNSIRISDHKGKKHLAYRYNVLTKNKGYGMATTPEGWIRHYYPVSMIDDLIKKILQDRTEKIIAQGGNKIGEYMYKKLMESRKRQHENDKGFWQEAELV